MGLWLGISRTIDAVNTRIGKLSAWLILLAVLVSTINAVVRYALNTSSNGWLELQWYLFSGTFLLVSAWTLLSGDHIRIDIVNQRFSKRVRNWIDLMGHLLFLLPVCVVMNLYGWPFFLLSLKSGEMSQNAGGLIIWPVKLLIPLGFLLLTLQCLSEVIKRIAIMRGDLEDKSGGGHHAAAEAEAERLLAIAQEQARTVGLHGLKA